MKRIGILAFACLFLVGCEFRSRRAVWSLGPEVAYRLQYAAEIRAKADGSWGASPYLSAAEAEFSVQATGDSALGQSLMAFTIDTLTYRSSERGPEEDQYMVSRLRKYSAKIVLSRTGQVLNLEEEPGMPPVEFSPIQFGRFMAYALPAFPDARIKQGSKWEIVQPLLDKFHPDSRVQKRFTLSAIRETPAGDLATLLVELDIILIEDLGAGQGAVQPTLTGSGQMVFNLSKGLPVSSDIELEGRFTSRLPQKAGDSIPPPPLAMRLKQKISLNFGI